MKYGIVNADGVIVSLISHMRLKIILLYPNVGNTQAAAALVLKLSIGDNDFLP